MNFVTRTGHRHAHALHDADPLVREGLALVSRRNMLKASLAGMAGLSLPDCCARKLTRPLRARRSRPPRASSFCGWLEGRVISIRGTRNRIGRCRTAGHFQSRTPGFPGTVICDRLPKQAGHARQVYAHSLRGCALHAITSRTR